MKLVNALSIVAVLAIAAPAFAGDHLAGGPSVNQPVTSAPEAPAAAEAMDSAVKPVAKTEKKSAKHAKKSAHKAAKHAKKAAKEAAPAATPAAK